MLEHITGEMIPLLSSIKHYPIPEYGYSSGGDQCRWNQGPLDSVALSSSPQSLLPGTSRNVETCTKGEVLYGDDAAVNGNGP